MIFDPDDKSLINFLNNIKSFGKIIKNDDIISEKFKNSSKILNNLNSNTSIIKWIKEKTNKNINNIDLIFTMTKNGSSSKDFHKFCDNKGPTLIIIKAKNDRIFGGFTPLNWEIKNGDNIYDESNQTFLFSLNLMKKFDMINTKKVAIRNASYGPSFGDWDLKIEENLKEGVSYANSSCNFFTNKNLELIGGKGDHTSFKVEDLEVYKVFLY